MSTTTTNLSLIKPELTDPADITALNPNWDAVDAQLKSLNDSLKNVPTLTVDSALSSTSTNPVQNKVIYNALSDKADFSHTHDYLPLAGGVLSGALTVIDNFNVNKTYNSVEYKTYVRPINYSIGSNGDYSTGILHYKGAVNDSQLMFNKDGVMLRDNVSGKAYHLFGQHNTDKITTILESFGAARIKTGSYTGTGTSGSANPCTLTFDFAPKLVVVMHSEFDSSSESSMIAVYGAPKALRFGYSNTVQSASTLTWSGTALSWYESDSKYQCNGSGQKYYYVAIG